MNGQIFFNNFKTTLAQALAAGATSPVLTTVEAIKDAPVQAPNDYGELVANGLGAWVALTIEPEGGAETAADYEIIYLTQIVDATGSQATVALRGQEGTTDKAWPQGSLVSCRWTAGAPNRVVNVGAERIILESYNVNYPAPGFVDAYGTGYDGIISIGNYGANVAGTESINIGFGSIGNPDPTVTGNVNESNINIGAGGVFGNGDNQGCARSLNIGDGGAYGRKAYNIGEGGAGAYCISIGSYGGAYASATQQSDGAINIGNGGSYASGGIQFGHGNDVRGEDAIRIGQNRAGTGTDQDAPHGVSIGSAVITPAAATDSVAIGTSSEVRTASALAIGHNAKVLATHTNSAAVGSGSATTQANQLNGGDRNLELGTATSSRGIHLYSPNGTRYKLTVDDTGAVTATADPIV